MPAIRSFNQIAPHRFPTNEQATEHIENIDFGGQEAPRVAPNVERQTRLCRRGNPTRYAPVGAKGRAPKFCPPRP